LLKPRAHRCPGAYAHQDLPFATLVKAFAAETFVKQYPDFPDLICFPVHSAVSSAPKELEAAPINTDLTTSKFDLALILAESEEELIAYWTYRTELFRPELLPKLEKTSTASWRVFPSTSTRR